MCILFFAINQHPDYPVIICANRDEFHQRPTQIMHWWDSENTKKTEPNILAGKDLQAGGTWLGLNKYGGFSALTNFRNPSKIDNNKQSRGNLVLNALKHQQAKSLDSLEQQLLNSSPHYNGYNLVYGSLRNLNCFNNISNSIEPLDTGVHSLCNGKLDDIWPKMALGEQALSQAITKNDELDIDDLFRIMQSNQQALPEHLPNTGISSEWEQLLSSIFIVSPEYGTRTTNIITLNSVGDIEVFDRSYNEQGEQTSTQNFIINNE